MIKALSAAVALGLMTVAAGGASAAVVYSQDFNSYVGTANGNQAITGLPIFTNGSVTGMSPDSNTANIIQAVQTSAGNYAAMLYDHDVIRSAAFSGNVLGQTYTVTYREAPAANGNLATATATGDILRFILQDGSNTNIRISDSDTGTFPNAVTSNTFRTVSFTYTGNGNGLVTLLVQDPNAVGRFGGAIDDIVVTDSTAAATAVPEPMSLALLGAGLVGASVIRRRKAA